ncbi:MAG: cytochrome c oxidase accessory protein CcoG [Cytophagaceae bacterium]
MKSVEEDIYADESFRDSIATIGEDGSRKWIYPKKPKGKFTNYRKIFGYSLFTLFLLMPFLRINDEPVLLLNIIERHFTILGVVFWPQDFHLFLLAMMTGIIFIVVFTAIFGRIFCGWICPQTIFMELLFRPIEYAIEGDYKKQMALNAAPLTGSKFIKKFSKHLAFFSLSFLISNVFLMYVIGSENWISMVTDNPLNHTAGLIMMLIFTGVFYGVYARFREQVCTQVCPYGRLQGVLTDKDTIVVAYDYERGEPRGKLSKGQYNTLKGDCVDCKLCVHVCPTGIDIRNGVQMECVNCTACIDACDEVMLKINKPVGLIRYASENAIANKAAFKLTKRVISYSLILLCLMSAMTVLLATRPDIQTSILRTPGMLYQEKSPGVYTNLYDLKIINKTKKTFPVSFKIENVKGDILPVGHIPGAQSKSITDGKIFIQLPESSLNGLKTELSIGVYHGNEKIETIKTTFVGPAQ